MREQFTDADEAEARYEALHGPVNRWTLGVIDTSGKHMTTEDVPDRDTALTALEQIASDVPGADDGSDEPAWETFYDALQASAGDVDLTAPDGRRYYAELIQR